VRRLPVRVEAAAVAATGKDGDAEWLTCHKWAQTPILHSRTIPGYRAHIARLPRARIKTRAGKAEGQVDSARATGDQEAPIVHMVRARIKTSRAGKAKGRVVSTRAHGDQEAPIVHMVRARIKTRAGKVEGRVDTAKVRIKTSGAGEAEGWVDTAKVRIKTSKAGKAEGRDDSARASRAEVSKAQAPESGAEAAEASNAEI
jgi:hypothetical protein